MCLQLGALRDFSQRVPVCPGPVWVAVASARLPGAPASWHRQQCVVVWLWHCLDSRCLSLLSRLAAEKGQYLGVPLSAVPSVVPVRALVTPGCGRWQRCLGPGPRQEGFSCQLLASAGLSGRAGHRCKTNVFLSCVSGHRYCEAKNQCVLASGLKNFP